MERRRTLMRSVGRVRRAWNAHVRDIAQAEGIPESYRQIIMFLFHHPGAAQRSMADFIGVTGSAVNQVVKSMLEDGFLRKEPDPADKRSYKLFLTEKGEAVAVRLHEKLDASDDAITAFIGAQREQEMMDLLDELADLLRKELGAC